MPNLGPATTVTSNSVAVLTPTNTTTNPGPQGLNARRLLASARGMSLAVTGDAAAMPVINAATYAVSDILVGNAVGGTAATGNITVNAGAAVSGTQWKAAGALAGVTGPTTVVAQTVTSTTVIATSQLIYVNVGTAVASAVDVFVYGYDLT